MQKPPPSNEQAKPERRLLRWLARVGMGLAAAILLLLFARLALMPRARPPVELIIENGQITEVSRASIFEVGDAFPPYQVDDLYGVRVTGGRAQVIDAAGQMVASLQGAGYATGAALDGMTLALTWQSGSGNADCSHTGGGGVILYDLSDPANVRQAAALMPPGRILDVTGSGQTWYIATSCGLRVARLNGSSLEMVTAISTSEGYPLSVGYHEGMLIAAMTTWPAYASSEPGTDLMVIRFDTASNPENPRSLRRDRIASGSGDVSLFEGYLLVEQSDTLWLAYPLPGWNRLR